MVCQLNAAHRLHRSSDCALGEFLVNANATLSSVPVRSSGCRRHRLYREAMHTVTPLPFDAPTPHDALPAIDPREEDGMRLVDLEARAALNEAQARDVRLDRLAAEISALRSRLSAR